MKRLTAIVCLCCLLVGCSSKNEPKIDDTKYNLDAPQNIPSNMNTYMRQILPTENHLVFLLPAKGEKGDGILLAAMQDDSLEILNSDPSTACSIDTPDKCSGFIYGMNTPSYYKGKLYWFSSEYDYTKDIYFDIIYRSEIDGTKREKIWKSKEYSVNNTSSSPYFMTFHRNHAYVSYRDSLYITDIDDFNLDTVVNTSMKEIHGLYFDEDTMYVYAKTYLDKTKEYMKVLLKCNLDGTVIDIVSENHYVPYADNQNFFYFSEDGVMMKNMNTNEETKVLNGDCIYFFYDGTNYLLDSILANDQPSLTLVSKNGEVLFTKVCDDKENVLHSPLLFQNNRLYIRSNGKFGYYEIKDNKILNYKEIV